MRIAILGDFGGSANGGIGGIRPPVEVDRDKTSTRSWPMASGPYPVADREFASRDLDGFRPDLLYTTLDVFAGLREAAPAPAGPRAPVGTGSEPPSLGLNGLLDQAIEGSRRAGRKPQPK